ncbi:MAG: response regulator [Anaerolineae bacterium]|nr:response regulator [Anaerolineae bacterium]
MDERTKFRNEIRDALAHLYDTAHLECHLLVPQLLKPNVSSRLTRAQMLRSLLKETIEALRPPQGDPCSAPQWRNYLALYHRYVKGMSFLEVQDELGISRRQLQREERKGIDAMTTMLWERRVVDAEPPVLSPTEEAGEVQLLRQELGRWEINRQVCALHTLLDDTLWMLRPILERLKVNLHVALPTSLDPVFVDPTLTRQALFKVLRMLAQASGEGHVWLRATPHPQTLDIILQGEQMSISQVEEDWEIARLLVSHQGGNLRQETVPGTAPSVVMSLPLASRARVLVVDDAKAALRLFERYLTPHNYEVIGTSNGTEALRLAAELPPDLIVLDVMMPKVDGWQVLRDLQSNSATAEIPVVVCSVLDEPELALSLGARAFVKKPVNRLDLLNTLERIRGEAAPEEAARRGATASS